MELPHDNALADSSVGPLVSVILPVHNRADWVARAIRSVLSQTYPHIELLVIDDGSTDGTRQVLDDFASRVIVFDQPHSGPEAARNLGLEHARGEFVAFIDSDDAWRPDRLTRQMPLFSRDEVGLVFGNATLVDYRQGSPRRLKRTFFDGVRPSRGRVLEAFAGGCFVPCSSVVARRQCFEVAGRFTPGRVAADYLKWLEISASYEMDYVPEPVFEYAIHANGISHSLPETLADRLEAFRELHARNRNPEIDRVVRRILFNLSISLRIARLRYGRKSSPVRPLIPPASPSERLNWALKFAATQISTRGRWMLKYAGDLSGWRSL